MVLTIALAFLGGALALLAPCGALLLPAYFSYTFSTRRAALVRMTGYYYAGLVTLFVPLGLGLTLLLKLIVFQRTALFTGVGALIILLGAFTIIKPLSLPQLAIHRQGPPRADALGIYMLGLTSGLTTGTCTAPILGSILTLAASSQTYLFSALLLLVYAGGMVATLLALALLFQRVGRPFGQWWSRWTIHVPLGARSVSVPGQQVARGALVMLVGALFIWTQGSFGLEDVYLRLGLTDLAFRLNVALTQATWALWLVVAAVVAIVIGAALTLWRRRKIRAGAHTLAAEQSDGAAWRADG